MNYRKLVASKDEKKIAGDILHDIFFNDHDDDDKSGMWLQDYLESRTPGVERILAADTGSENDELPYDSLPRLLVDLYGSELFEAKMGYGLRDKILEKLYENEQFRKIFEIFLASKKMSPEKIKDLKVQFSLDKSGESKKYVESMNDHKKTPWSPGGPYARKFVDQLRLPPFFAGIRSDAKRERMINVESKSEIKDLKNFQENMKNQIVEILEGSDEKRAIITLPTGGGKTRVAAEAVVEYLNNHGVDQNILWIAQSDEVCEQAVLCFKQIWELKGNGEQLQIFRAWGKHDLPTSEEHGIIVGGIQKLISKKNQLHNFVDHNALSAVFIDEAHHSTADSYTEILSHLHLSSYKDGILENDSSIPLIGLTATPERRLSSETKNLHRMYGEKRIYPNAKYLPDSEDNDPFDDDWGDLRKMRIKLTDLKYLAHPTFYGIDPGKKIITLSESETKDLEGGGDSWMKRVATESERNSNIKNEILKWARKGRKILYFGTNVTQSITMAKILEKEGITSASITAETRFATRKMFIEIFNEPDSNEMQVMCNYNVLSTGFDSPQIDTVIIARPTTSVVSYQQMVGRGLRGEEFGGKHGNKCEIVTVKDNIEKYNHAVVELGHSKYEEEVEDAKINVSDPKNVFNDELDDAEQPSDNFENMVPKSGESFTSDEIYKKYGVQKQGGIRYTTKHNFVILIDAEISNYPDHVNEKTGDIIYNGTGEKDQGFDKGHDYFNSQVKNPDSVLLYFQKPAGSQNIFKYLVKYVSHDFKMEENKRHEKRKVIKFKLKIIKKSCPQCKIIFASNDSEIEEKFGYRTTNGNTIVQSWCKNCRAK
jgi:superfamily II DNA or RNA helicase